MAPRVVVVGDVVTDVSVRLLGPLAVDADTPASISVQGGGSGANLAAWLAGTGTEVDFVARVAAADLPGHAAELARAGVRPHLVPDPDAGSAMIVVIVDRSGRRTMLTDRGGNVRLGSADIDPALLTGATHVHLSGYVLLSPTGRAAASMVMSAARHAGVPVSLDPGSASFLAALGVAQFHELAAGTALLAPNLDEARLLTGVRSDRPVELAARLCAAYPLVLLSAGARGAVVARRGEPPYWLPSADVTVTDTTGAGDALLAGFLGSLLRGSPPESALSAGLELAARAVADPGGRPRTGPAGVPSDR